jgi:hypothetical protein
MVRLEGRYHILVVVTLTFSETDKVWILDPATSQSKEIPYTFKDVIGVSWLCKVLTTKDIDS